MNVMLFGPHHIDEDHIIWPDPPGPTVAIEVIDRNTAWAADIYARRLGGDKLLDPRHPEYGSWRTQTREHRHPHVCKLEGPFPESGETDLEQTGSVLAAGDRRLVYVPEGDELPDDMTVVKWHGFVPVRWPPHRHRLAGERR